MIIFTVMMIVVTVSDLSDFQAYQERAFQQFKAISDRERDEQRAAIEALQAMSHTITCSRCGWVGEGYTTPGRAKMGLSGHQKSCRKVLGQKIRTLG